jgi:OPT family oligopeptide transporter
MFDSTDTSHYSGEAADSATLAKHLAHIESLPVDEREAYWYANVFQGDRMPQLTIRSTLMGFGLGAVMALSNLYIGLKTGWALGVVITSCILSFSICKLLRIRFSILESNCMASTASSAGYSTGGTMVSGVAAYLMLTGHHMPVHVLALWTFFLAALGVFIAIPMKRQMIDQEQLRFPSGVAAAETLHSLHAEGQDSSDKAAVLASAGAFAGIWKILQGGFELIPETWPAAGSAIDKAVTIAGQSLSKWTIQLECSSVMMAAGAIIGWRVSWSLLLGAVINYFFLAPAMMAKGAIHVEKLGFREITSWSLWPGVAVMVVSSLFLFLLQWKVLLRSVTGFSKSSEEGAGHQALESDRVQVPSSWFLQGSLVAGYGCVFVLCMYFDTKLWVAVVAVLLSFVLCLVACRATGESDITPMGAMGKVAQLTFAGLAPSNMVTNLMTASVTAGAASASADLLSDLKSGYLLGANPRKQFVAQFLGIFAGTLVTVPAFYLMVPLATDLGGAKYPAPAAQVWRKVAELLANGFHSLHPTAQQALVYGAIVGLILPLLELLFPKAKSFIPSATGVGLAFVLPFYNSLAIFLGAVFALIAGRVSSKWAEKYVVPLSAGLIAGESLVGVALELFKAVKPIVLAYLQR